MKKTIMAYGLPNVTPSHLAALKRSRTILKARYGYGDPRIKKCEQEIRNIEWWTRPFSNPTDFKVYYKTCDRSGNYNDDYDKGWATAFTRYEAACIVALRNWNVYQITDVLIM